MLLSGFCANTDLPLYWFLQRTAIRIQIGGKYAELARVVHIGVAIVLC
jgi:hypothetical protein